MIHEGQVVVFTFPQTNLGPAKLRPALVLRKLPGKYQDWLTCMITSKLDQKVEPWDEIISELDNDYVESGLKAPSLIRVTRLAVQDCLLIRGAMTALLAGRGILNDGRWRSPKRTVANNRT